MSRLQGFQDLASSIARTGLQHRSIPSAGRFPKALPLSFTGITMQGFGCAVGIEEVPVKWLEGLDSGNGRSVADAIASLFMQVGENLVLRRATLLHAPNVFSHPKSFSKMAYLVLDLTNISILCYSVSGRCVWLHAR